MTSDNLKKEKYLTLVKSIFMQLGSSNSAIDTQWTIEMLEAKKKRKF